VQLITAAAVAAVSATKSRQLLVDIRHVSRFEIDIAAARIQDRERKEDIAACQGFGEGDLSQQRVQVQGRLGFYKFLNFQHPLDKS
jgi:hypothetical protein